jgi:hypothetical protein
MAEWIKSGENPQAAGKVTYGIEGQAATVTIDSAGNITISGTLTATGGSNPSGAAGGDLGGAYPNPTVVATHLTAPLPAAQGGTGGTGPGIWTPSVNGLLAASGDPRMMGSQAAVTNGVIYLEAVDIPISGNPTTIQWGNQAAGVSPVAGQNWAALVNPAGTVVASVGVDTQCSTPGLVSATFTAVAATPGTYRVALLFNAATPPTLFKHTNLATMVNANLSAANYRAATSGGGATTMPPSFTLSSNTASTNPWWVGVL